MATVITTIGTKSGLDDVISVSGGGPTYVCTLNSVPVDALVGDTLVIDPGGSDDPFLITGISGNDLTVEDVLGVGGAPVVDTCEVERTYSSIPNWDADLDDSTLYSSGDDAEGRLTKDTAFNVTAVISGGTIVGLNSVTLTSPVGERHDGTRGTGARIVLTSPTANEIISPDRVSFYLTWIEIDANDNCTNIRMYGGDSTFDDRVVSHCIFHDHTVTNSWAFGIDLRIDSISNGTLAIHNNQIFDIESSSTNVAHTCLGIVTLADEAGDTSYVYNNLVDRITRINSGAAGDARAIHTTDHAGTLVKNNVCGNVGGAGTGARVCYVINSPSNADMDYNLAEDTTASGDNSLNSKTIENSIISNTDGSEDYETDTTGDTHLQGVDLVDTPVDVGEDAFGVDRDGLGLVWSMGPSQGGGEVVAAGLATESDTVLKRVHAVGLATESGISQTITSQTTHFIGITEEQDSALPALELGNPQRALEFDSSLAATAIVTVTVGLSVESDTALAITSAKGDEAGLATESDISQAAPVVHLIIVGLATESDISQTALRIEFADQVVESNISQTASAQIQPFAELATESDDSLAVVLSLVTAVGQTVENDIAQTVGLVSVGLVTESDIGQAVTSLEVHPAIALVVESDIALAALPTLLVGLTTESDISQTVTSLKTEVVGLSTESDISQTLTAVRIETVGLSIESDVSQAVTLLRTALVGLTTESDISQTVTSLKTEVVGLSTESDISQTLTAVRIETVGLSIESDVSQTVVIARTLEVGLTTESDDALTASSLRERHCVTSIVVESDISQSVTASEVHLAIGLPTESDVSQAVTSLKTEVVGLSTESDISQANTSLKTEIVGLSTESDISQAVTSLKTETVGLSTESDAVLTLSTLKTEILSLVTESDIAFGAPPEEAHVAALVIESDTTLGITSLKLQAVGLPTESDTALDPVGRPTRIHAVGQSIESDAVLAVVRAKLQLVGITTESDDALVIGPLKTEIVGLSTESDIVHAIGILSEQLVGQPVESNDAFAVVAIKTITTGQAIESDTTFSVARFKLQTAGLATEVDSVLLMMAKKAQAIGLAVESDTSFGFSPERIVAVGLATEEDTTFAVQTLELKEVALTIESDIALATTGIFLVVVPFGVVEGEVFIPGVQQGEMVGG